MNYFGWSISDSLEHCYHAEGINVYVDPIPTKCGAIRLLGPFLSCKKNERFVEKALRQLCEFFEFEVFEKKFYVVWGTYQATPDYREHSFPISGSCCGYLPQISARTVLFRECFGSLSHEWVASEISGVHKSGYCPRDSSCRLDAMVFHPSNINFQIMALSKFATNHQTDERFVANPQNAIQQLVWTPAVQQLS